MSDLVWENILLNYTPVDDEEWFADQGLPGPIARDAIVVNVYSSVDAPQRCSEVVEKRVQPEIDFALLSSAELAHTKPQDYPTLHIYTGAVEPYSTDDLKNIFIEQYNETLREITRIIRDGHQNQPPSEEDIEDAGADAWLSLEATPHALHMLRQQSLQDLRRLVDTMLCGYYLRERRVLMPASKMLEHLQSPGVWKPIILSTCADRAEDAYTPLQLDLKTIAGETPCSLDELGEMGPFDALAEAIRLAQQGLAHIHLPGKTTQVIEPPPRSLIYHNLTSPWPESGTPPCTEQQILPWTISGWPVHKISLSS